MIEKLKTILEEKGYDCKINEDELLVEEEKVIVEYNENQKLFIIKWRLADSWEGIDPSAETPAVAAEIVASVLGY